MNFAKIMSKRAFRRPKGVIGRLGGMVMARRNRRMARQAIELLDIQHGDRVLEVGFGPGVAIQLLAHSTSAQSVTGIDPSRKMFEQAQARNAAAIEAGKIILWRRPVERLGCKNSTFDKALAIRSMQLWADPTAGLREIQRALQPGGRIVLGFTRHSGQTTKGLTELLSTAGFTGTRVVHGKGAYFALAIKAGERCDVRRPEAASPGITG